MIKRFTLVASALCAAALALTYPATAAWNDPYPAADADQNTLYSSFTERPKHLDPVRSYSENEASFIGQVYEPVVQYHYLKRPYTLEPLTARELPAVRYFDAAGTVLPEDAPAADIVVSEYEIAIKPGIRYQPHPALARNADGAYVYHALDAEFLRDVHTLADFPEMGTRELIAEDYIYQIKRLADPKLHSPIAGVMAEYIVGHAELAETLGAAREAKSDTDPFLDLRDFDLEGVELVDPFTYRIRINGKYPQFVYWLAMTFFAPMPWEADRFYSQAGMEERNITLHWYPIGTGPYMLTENNPNLRMVLVRNPNFRDERYPGEGELQDAEQGLLDDAGKRVPFIDRAVYSLEKETIPRWNKFLQGYFDNSGISSDSFDQAIEFTAQGDASLTDAMREKGIALSTSVSASIYYMGFNMRDPVLGGDSARARKLRRAIAIAVDFEEFISIFTNGRGIASQSPVPPGIFGHREGEAGINPYVYDWVKGQPKRKPISEARELLAEAGYRDGVDAKTGKPLVLHFEAVARGPDDKARLNWIRKQFDKLGIQLVIRTTDYNRFQDKMLKGTGEIFLWGWNADYPDPENFFFLLYGPNAKVDHQGENAANYTNAEYDRLFEQMKNMENGPERQGIIDQMVEILRRDSPWMWGFHPKDFVLHHAWYGNEKPNLMARNRLKYKKLDPQVRKQRREDWNEPVLWPLGLLAGVLGLSVVPAVVSYRRREQGTAL